MRSYVRVASNRNRAAFRSGCTSPPAPATPPPPSPTSEPNAPPGEPADPTPRPQPRHRLRRRPGQTDGSPVGDRAERSTDLTAGHLTGHRPGPRDIAGQRVESDTTPVISHWQYAGTGLLPELAHLADLLAATRQTRSEQPTRTRRSERSGHLRSLHRSADRCCPDGERRMIASTELLTVPRVMERLQLGRTAVYDLLRTRKLPSLALGRARRIPAHALDHLITTRLHEQDNAA